MVLGILIGMLIGAIVYWQFGMLGLVIAEGVSLVLVFAVAIGMVLGGNEEDFPEDEPEEEDDDDDDGYDDPEPDPVVPPDDGFVVPMTPNGGTKAHIHQ